MVPESDAQALGAYLHLLARVVARGPPARVQAWVGEWEALCLVTPLWELPFQLMCHPVPQVSAPHPPPRPLGSCWVWMHSEW